MAPTATKAAKNLRYQRLNSKRPQKILDLPKETNMKEYRLLVFEDYIFTLGGTSDFQLNWIGPWFPEKREQNEYCKDDVHDLSSIS